MIERLVAAAVVAGIGSFLATRLAERVARGRDLYDVPNERSSHETPTPRLGGLGIIAGTLAGWLVAGGWNDGPSSAIIVAALILASVGFLDDIGRTSVLGKYAGQLAASALVAVVLQPVFEGRGDVVWAVGGVSAMVITTIGLTALINAVNFMDGIDGLIGGVAMVAALLALAIVAVAAWPMLVALAAACAGFLFRNLRPSTIFMGDTGSHFIGLLLGAGLLHRGGATVDVVPPLILFSPLLFDTGFTLIRRARAGRDLFAGHREHLYQRLVISGLSHRQVAAGYILATAVAGGVAIAWSSAPTAVQVGVLVAGIAIAAGFVAWVGRSERAVSRTAGPTPS